MDPIEIIHRRRSIRNFNGKPISDENLEKILSAGMTAPSAMNSQPWRFIVINDKKIKTEITKISHYANMCLEAPIVILVCGDETADKIPDYWPISCSACIQNMLLTACTLGIASVWTGVYPIKEIVNGYKKLFNLPESIIPHSLVIFGYSDKDFERRDYFDSKKVHYNKW